VYFIKGNPLAVIIYRKTTRAQRDHTFGRAGVNKIHDAFQHRLADRSRLTGNDIPQQTRVHLKFFNDGVLRFRHTDNPRNKWLFQKIMEHAIYVRKSNQNNIQANIQRKMPSKRKIIEKLISAAFCLGTKS
jgi:hypothetical protein